MGYRAVAAAFDTARELELGDRPARLLIFMASVVLDDTQQLAGREVPAGHYWRGWQASAQALGWDVPDDAIGDDYPQAQQSVKRTMRALADKGAIERVRFGGGHKTAEWSLTFFPIPIPLRGAHLSRGRSRAERSSYLTHAADF